MAEEDNTKRAVRSRTRVVVVAVALGVLVIGAIVAAANGSDSPAAPATVPSTVAGVASQPDATGATKSSQPAEAATGAPADQIVVTVAGTVKTVLPDGDFVVNDGHTDYTVSMSSAPSIVDLDGATAAADLIQLGGSVQVTGTVSGTTITADTVIVPIRPAPPTPHT
ncbi:MAG TPA: hypothetical protein VHQ23_13820 [Ilumatobacteraceae bacterium]|nr:hypothetical protein [Ilumatobacteraceae bacterium]